MISWSGGQNYKRQQLSCLDSGWGKASSTHPCRVAGSHLPERLCLSTGQWPPQL